jgi:hypothetical protein
MEESLTAILTLLPMTGADRLAIVSEAKEFKLL